QPVDERRVVLQRAGGEAAGDEEQVVGTERFIHYVGSDAQAAIVREALAGGAKPPLEIGHDLHRLQARDRVVEADEVERRHAVEDDERGLHSASKYSSIL